MYICILDFEATCGVGIDHNEQEIIQFPSILYKYIDDKVIKIDSFDEYVKPMKNQTLNEFCIKLTGIQQDTVNKASSLEIVYKKHLSWLLNHTNKDDLVVFVIVGKWDLNQLNSELNRLNIKIDTIYKNYIDISNDFSKFYNTKYKGLINMLKHLNLEYTGHQHNGMDDCINTEKIFEKMISDGYNIKQMNIITIL